MERYPLRRRRYFYILSGCYLLLLFVLCITRFNLIGSLFGIAPTFIDSVNLIPFRSILLGIRRFGALSWDAFGNMVMFLPIGILFSYYCRKENFFMRTIFLSLLTTCGIEALQYLFKTGAVDIDDVLLNSTGGVIGAVLFLLIYKISGKQLDTTRRIVEICATIFPPYLAFYVLNFFLVHPYHFQLFHLLFFIVYFVPVAFLLLRDLGAKEKGFYWGTTTVFSLYFFFIFL